MKKRYFTQTKVATLSMAVLFIICAVLPLIAMAQQKQLNHDMVDNEKIIPLPTKTVTIEKKMLEAVITNTGDRFKLSEETIIVGLNNEQVSIRNMLVPCDAKITYERKHGRRIAQRINILRISDNNTWHWHSDVPE